MIPARVVLATTNAGKVRELGPLVAAWGVGEVVGLDAFPGVTLPPETEETYAGNAIVKARTVALACGVPALGDDSGLEVTALGGQPGVRSARWAPTDAERIAKVLAALDGVADRRARFVCAAALAWPDGRVVVTEGTCEGHIAARAEGSAGFGYDPVFVATELGRALALVDRTEKAAVSHRGRAVRALGEKLRDATLRRSGGPC